MIYRLTTTPSLPREDHPDVVRLRCMLDQNRQMVLNLAAAQIPADLRRHLEPQDVLQETFLEAFRRLAEFREQSPAATSSWLVLIARHQVLNLVRSHRSKKRGGDRTQLDEHSPSTNLPGMLAALAVYERTPSQSALDHEQAAALEEALIELLPDYRSVLRLRFVDQLPFSEVAAEMGRSVGSVQMLCQRALAALREILPGEE